MGKIAEWWARSTDALTSAEVLDRLKKVERAVELRYLAQPQAEVDKALSEGAAELIKAVSESRVAVIQLGSLLVLKVPDRTGAPVVLARSLSSQELIVIENSPEILLDPTNLLETLRARVALARTEPDDVGAG